jgi:hypothetical protein
LNTSTCRREISRVKVQISFVVEAKGAGVEIDRADRRHQAVDDQHLAVKHLGWCQPAGLPIGHSSHTLTRARGLEKYPIHRKNLLLETVSEIWFVVGALLHTDEDMCLRLLKLKRLCRHYCRAEMGGRPIAGAKIDHHD